MANVNFVKISEVFYNQKEEIPTDFGIKLERIKEELLNVLNSFQFQFMDKATMNEIENNMRKVIDKFEVTWARFKVIPNYDDCSVSLEPCNFETYLLFKNFKMCD